MTNDKIVTLVGKTSGVVGRIVLISTDDGIQIEGEMTAPDLALSGACLSALAAKIAMDKSS